MTIPIPATDILIYYYSVKTTTEQVQIDVTLISHQWLDGIRTNYLNASSE